jgi:hypothetical protein
MMRIKELLQAFVQRRHFLCNVQRMVSGADFLYNSNLTVRFILTLQKRKKQSRNPSNRTP